MASFSFLAHLVMGALGLAVKARRAETLVL